MQASPFLEEILYLVAQFLHKAKQEDIATQLQQHISLPAWVLQNNPLMKKGLIKIVKQYVKSQPAIQNYYLNRHHQTQEEEQEEIVVPQRKRSSERLRKQMSPSLPKKVQTHNSKVKNSPKTHNETNGPKNQASSWMSKFQKPKRLEDIQTHQKIENPKNLDQPKENKVKASKKQKKEKIESSDYESQEDSFQLEPKKKLKKQVKIQKIQTKQKEKAKIVQTNGDIQEIKVIPKTATQQQNSHYQREQQSKYNNQGPKKFFSRINVNDLQPIKNQLMDNSFDAKAKFGQAADQWGKFGYEKLKDTRGDSFKKTKGKLKNRAFQGSLMDVNLINSIPIL